jgi:hypothetical protein
VTTGSGQRSDGSKREDTPPGEGIAASAHAADRDELDRFKRHVSLLEFAISKGYRLDKRESSLSSKVLRHEPTDDKLVVGRARDGHWQYFSVRDSADNGTIIDFLQRRERKTLGQIRHELREWTHTTREFQVPASHREVAPTTRDRALIALEVARAEAVTAHPYLVRERALQPETLNAERFRGTWKVAVASHGNVLFLHHDERGLCGFEIKNRGFTGFAKGGEKGIWLSNSRATDTRLVIAESAIDALSYHQLRPSEHTRYVSVAGALNRHQPDLLERAMARMRAGSTIVAGTDNDKAGHELAQRIRELGAKHADLRFERHVPEVGKDWNDQLRASLAVIVAQKTNRSREPDRGA